MYRAAPGPSELVTRYIEILGSGKSGSHYSKRWRFICPACRADKLEVNFAKEGAFYCFVCKYKGFYQKLERDFGDKVPVTQADLTPLILPEPREISWPKIKAIYSWAYTHGQLLEEHESWLIKRGFNKPNRFFSTDTVINKIQERFDSEDLIQSGLFGANEVGRLYPRRVFKRGRIAIPYMDPDNQELVWYLRSRAVCPNNKQDRYQAPYGVPQSGTFFGAESVFQGTDKILISEGEFKIRSAIERGFPGISTPGINSSHKGMVDFCSRREVKNVFFIFDTETENDSLGRSKQKTVILYNVHKLARLFKESEIPSYHISLPLLGEPKMDLDSFFLKRGSSAVEDLNDLIKKARRVG
jgi:hypothetical protein